MLDCDIMGEKREMLVNCLYSMPEPKNALVGIISLIDTVADINKGSLV